MGRYENIREYSEFNHTASMHGGPQKYFEENAILNYEAGKKDEKAKDPVKIVIASTVAITIWELCKKIRREISNRRQLKDNRESPIIELDEGLKETEDFAESEKEDDQI